MTNCSANVTLSLKYPVACCGDSLFDVESLDSSDELNGNGFYLIVGTRKWRSVKALDYCGITERPFYQRLREHRRAGKFDRSKDDVEIWLGKCEQPARPDRATLLRAEHMLVTGWDVEGNSQGKASFPQPTCLVMRWYFRDWRPRKRRPSFTRSLPDVLWFENETWWTGKLRVQDAV